MSDQLEEKVLDEEEWKNEAKAVIKDVEVCVKEIVISDKLPSSNFSVYCNLTTLEEEKYCIELSASGFRIVGQSYNDNCLESEEYFETPYALLDNISPRYREKFSSALAAKLLLISETEDRNFCFDE